MNATVDIQSFIDCRRPSVLFEAMPTVQSREYDVAVLLGGGW